MSTEDKKAVGEEVALNTQNVPAALKDFKSMGELLNWATLMIDSELLPASIREPESVVTILTMGAELGLKPMVALQNLHVIAGRPTISSAMIGSLLHRAGIEFQLVNNYIPLKKDNKIVNYKTTYKFFHESTVIAGRIIDQEFSITWSQMKKSGYTEKDNWEKYPQEMMRARCMAYACRALFPWVLSGMYTELEINDIADRGEFDELDVKVNDEGDIVIDTEVINEEQ